MLDRMQRIERATHLDLSAIRSAYAHGRSTQAALGESVWPEFSDESILREVDAGRLYRVVSDSALTGVFSVAYEDPAIWDTLETGSHVYLHRIARAAEWQGRGLMDVILGWASSHCRELGLAGVRVDTWASNRPLIEFYERRGFRRVGTRRIEVDPRLPSHYYNNEFALLEHASPISRKS